MRSPVSMLMLPLILHDCPAPPEALLWAPGPREALLEQLRADLFPIRSIDVDERPV
jgi:hypothetical protein